MSVFDSKNTDRMQNGKYEQSHAVPPSSHYEHEKEIIDKRYVVSLNNVLSRISSDSDVLLVAILLWLLYKDGADTKLLIALAYIIL